MTEEQNAAFDERAIVRLREIGGQKLVFELLGVFLKNAPLRVEAAQRGLHNGDLTAVLHAAHSMKSSAATVGAVALAHAAVRLEAESRAPASPLLPDLVRRFAEALDQVRPVLEARLKAAAARPRIAVVEDNADNRLLVRAMLAEDYDVSEYETGIEALAGIRASPPALILLDVSLPGMDGIEVLGRLRADETTKRIPAIALTAHAMAGDRERFIQAGFNDYVAKPIVDEAVLRKAIEQVLAC